VSPGLLAWLTQAGARAGPERKGKIPVETCVLLRRDMLVDPVDVLVDDEALDWEKAKSIADRKAREISQDAILVAWFDRARGTFSPPVECGGKEKPAWLVYAETRGARIVIDINRETYVFVYFGEPSTD
jgi:hypothetical protein